MISKLGKLLMRRKISHRTPRRVGAYKSYGSYQEINAKAKLSFEETVVHMNRGYENTQRVIQFLDTKAGAVIAFCVALFAFTAKIAAWAYNETGSVPFANIPLGLATILGLLGVTTVGSGALCLLFSFYTIRPKGLPEPEHFTTLFPAMRSDDGQSASYLESIQSGESKGFILEEYSKQLAAVGQIVYGKIDLLKKSVSALIVQGVASVFLGGLIGYVAITGGLKKPENLVTIDGNIQGQLAPISMPK